MWRNGATSARSQNYALLVSKERPRRGHVRFPIVRFQTSRSVLGPNFAVGRELKRTAGFGLRPEEVERRQRGRFLPVISCPHRLCGLQNLSKMEAQESQPALIF